MSVHARTPPRDAAPRWPSPSPDPGTPRPAGRSSLGPRSRPAGLARRSPDPIPDPCPRAPFSGPRAARQVRTLSLLPKPSAGSEAQGRQLIRSRHPRSRGGGAAELASPSSGLQAGDLAAAARPGGAGRAPARPHVPPRPHSHSVGNEQSALDHHVREEIQLEGRSHVRGTPGARRADGGRRCARPSGRGRRDGQGQVRAASPRRPPKPALVTFSPLPRSANPLRNPAPRPRSAERQVRRAEAELRARAPPLNP